MSMRDAKVGVLCGKPLALYKIEGIRTFEQTKKWQECFPGKKVFDWAVACPTLTLRAWWRQSYMVGTFKKCSVCC